MIIKTVISLTAGDSDRDMALHPRRGFSRSLGFPGLSAPLCTQYRLYHRRDSRGYSHPCPTRDRPCRIAAAGYLVVSFILGNVVEPRLMGRRLGLSTLVVFLSLIFWGSLLGLIGVVLCIPFTMTLKFACENNKSTRWIAVLLGPEGAR